MHNPYSTNCGVWWILGEVQLPFDAIAFVDLRLTGDASIRLSAVSIAQLQTGWTATTAAAPIINTGNELPQSKPPIAVYATKQQVCTLSSLTDEERIASN